MLIESEIRKSLQKGALIAIAKRGFCHSCGARRMAETAAQLADDVPPGRPLRRWVLSLPHALRFLLATDPDALTRVLGVAYRTITGHLLRAAGLTRTTGQTGAGRCVPGFRSAALEGRSRGEART